MAEAGEDVGAASELREGQMRAVEVAGQQILLSRVGGACHAVGAICPHAGANLAEGVLRAGVVVCPWHKAAFDVTTGRRTEPPAVDDLPRFAVDEVAGRLLVTRPPPGARSTTAAVAEPRTMAIVGAGAAGAAAAQTLREAGFGGRVVLIGREDRLPYDRTVLSKYTLSGEPGAEKSPLQDDAFYRRHGIERLARTVAAVDPARRTIGFDDGEMLAYDAALVATGGTPRPLVVPGGGRPGVFLLRDVADAEAIVAAADPAEHIVVAGAGFIAMEAAASLRERGRAVTVVAPQEVPFQRQLGAEIGHALRRVHERRGVRFRLGDQIAAVEGTERVDAVRLRSGATLPADMVVAGLGIAPATGMLGALAGEGGAVSVDSRLRLADALYAAGDIAAFPLRGDGERVRVEHWRVAQQHGRVAAWNMLGRDVAYDAVPVFWTTHFLQRLDYVGHAETWDELTIDGDLAVPEFLAFFVQAGRVAAVAGWQRDRQMAAAVHLLTERRDWPVAELRRALGG